MFRYHILLLATLFALTNVAVSNAEDAIEFELEALDGEDYSLEGLLEECKLLVLDFWQVGCKPCNELLPHLQEYFDEYKDDGVEFVIISRDTSLTLAQVEPFFAANKYTFMILLDTDLEVSGEYGVHVSPATFIIKPDGELIYRHYGYKSGQEVEVLEIVEAFLAGEELVLAEDE